MPSALYLGRQCRRHLCTSAWRRDAPRFAAQARPDVPAVDIVRPLFGSPTDTKASINHTPHGLRYCYSCLQLSHYHRRNFHLERSRAAGRLFHSHISFLRHSCAPTLLAQTHAYHSYAKGRSWCPIPHKDNDYSPNTSEWAAHHSSLLPHPPPPDKMPTFVASIDQGTTSTRFIIFDKAGNVVAQHQLEFEQIYPDSGYVLCSFASTSRSHSSQDSLSPIAGNGTLT